VAVGIPCLKHFWDLGFGRGCIWSNLEILEHGMGCYDIGATQ